jgi:RNA polymerase-binding transcription factor
MATKKPKKKSVVKTAKKKTKPSARKSPLKSKPKSSGKVKPASKKPAVRKTAVKKKTKAPGKSKKTAPQKTMVKKVSAKTRPKPVVKKTSLKRKQKISQKKKPAVKRTPAKKESMKIKRKPAQKAKLHVITPVPKPASKSSEDARKAGLRKALVTKREQIVREVKSEISKYIKGETRQLVDTALDDGDWSVVDLSEDISLKQLSTHGETLRKIDEALRKVDEGTYGICEDCGEEISEKRLKILPFAIYCIDCQENREQFEEMERREGI